MKTHPSLGTEQGLLQGGHRVVTTDVSHTPPSCPSLSRSEGPQDLTQHLGNQVYPEGRAGPHADCGGNRDPQGGAYPPLWGFLPGRLLCTAPRPCPVFALKAPRGRDGHGGPGREQDTIQAAQCSPANLCSVSTAPQADGSWRWPCPLGWSPGIWSPGPRPQPALSLCGDRWLPFKSPFRQGCLSSQHVIRNKSLITQRIK